MNDKRYGGAAVLSVFLPGLGQLLKGQMLRGFVWFLVVIIGYGAMVLPGFLLHIFCVHDALVTTAPEDERRPGGDSDADLIEEVRKFLDERRGR